MSRLVRFHSACSCFHGVFLFDFATSLRSAACFGRGLAGLALRLRGCERLQRLELASNELGEPREEEQGAREEERERQRRGLEE
eukprot:3774947-Rhodomonas_salina.1